MALPVPVDFPGHVGLEVAHEPGQIIPGISKEHVVVIRKKVKRVYFNPLAVKVVGFDQPVEDDLIDLLAWQHQELLLLTPVCDEMNRTWLMKSDISHLFTPINSEFIRNLRHTIFQREPTFTLLAENNKKPKH